MWAQQKANDLEKMTRLGPYFALIVVCSAVFWGLFCERALHTVFLKEFIFFQRQKKVF